MGDSLYLRGFRNFAVANLPDLGIVPTGLQDPGLDASDVPLEFRYHTSEDCRAVRAEHICRNGANYYRSERMSNVTVEFNTALALETQKWQDAHGHNFCSRGHLQDLQPHAHQQAAAQEWSGGGLYIPAGHSSIQDHRDSEQTGHSRLA